MDSGEERIVERIVDSGEWIVERSGEEWIVDSG